MNFVTWNEYIYDFIFRDMGDMGGDMGDMGGDMGDMGGDMGYYILY